MMHMCRLLAVVLATAVFMFGCSSDGSSEAKSLMKKQISITEDYVNGLTDAKSSEDVVDVIRAYTDDMKELIPELQDFHKKYPEYRQGKMPEGMEAEVKRLEEISAKIPGAMMQVTAYMLDIEVQKAMTQMGQEMSKLQQ